VYPTKRSSGRPTLRHSQEAYCEVCADGEPANTTRVAGPEGVIDPGEEPVSNCPGEETYDPYCGGENFTNSRFLEW
jgi:hypothetical protein